MGEIPVGELFKTGKRQWICHIYFLAGEIVQRPLPMEML